MDSNETIPAIRKQVEEAAGLEWAQFEARHPALAAVLDQDLVIQVTTARLADDPDFQKALNDAAAAGLGAQALRDLLRGEVRMWLEKLLA